MKKITSILLTLALVFSLLPAQAFAIDGVPNIDIVCVRNGSKLTATVSVDDYTEMAALQFNVNYDATKMSISGTTNDDGYNSGITLSGYFIKVPPVINDALSGGGISFVSAVAKGKTSSKETLATIVFDIKDGAAGGTALTLSNFNVSVKDHTDVSNPGGTHAVGLFLSAIPVTIAAPEKYAAAQTSIDSGDGYTAGSLSWSPELVGGKFAPGTAYTVTETLTADSTNGYKFPSGQKIQLNSNTSVTPSSVTDSTLTFSYTFPKTADQAVTAIAISSANDTTAVPAKGSSATTLQLTATGTDSGNPVDISSAVAWSITAPTKHTGISVSNTGLLSVDYTAAGNEFTSNNLTVTVEAAVGAVTQTKEITITREDPIATTVKIYRDGKELNNNDTVVMPVTGGADKTYTYSAKLFDQYDTEMTGQAFAWTNGTIADSSHVSAQNGVVTVKAGATKDGTFDLTATAVGKSATVNVKITDVSVIWTAVDALFPAGKTAVYGTKDSEIAVLPAGGTATAGNVNLEGAFAYATPNAVQNASDTAKITVMFTITTEGTYKNVVVSKTYDVKVTQKPLTVTGLTATNRAYDGTTTVALTGGALVGVIAADNSKVTGICPTTGTIVSANVGTAKAVTQAAVTISGDAAGNYTVTQPTVTVNITKAAIDRITTAAPVSTVDAFTAYVTNHWNSAVARNAAMKTSLSLPAKVTVSFSSSKTEDVAIAWADTTVAYNAKGAVYTYVGSISGATGGTTNFESSSKTLTATLTVAPATISTVTKTDDTALPTQLTAAKAKVTEAGNLVTLGIPGEVKLNFANINAYSGDVQWSKTLDDAITTAKTVTDTSGDKTVVFTMTDGYFPWATMPATAPTITLTITNKYPVTVNFTTPVADVTYGTATATPAATQVAIENSTDPAGTFTYTYSGTGSTKYGPSTTAPTDAGTYQVTATLNSSTHSGTATDTFKISQKNITVAFADAGSPVYNNTAKAVTATPSGMVNSDALTVTLSYANKAGTAAYGPSATAPTNAGTYVVTATALTGTNAKNYMLSGTLTHEFTIAKADRADVTVTPDTTITPMTLTTGKLSDTIKVTVADTSDLDKSAAANVSCSSSNTAAVTVSKLGTVTAVANGNANITVTIAESTNYNTYTHATKVAVTAWTQPITGATVAADTGANNDLTASVSGNTIKVAGIVDTGAKKLTVTPTGASAVDITVDVADIGKTKTVDVNIGGQTVTYTIDTTGVTVKPANMEFDLVRPSPTASDNEVTDTDADAKAGMNEVLGIPTAPAASATPPQVEDLDKASAKALAPVATKAVEAAPEADKSAFGTDYKTVVETTVKFTGKSYVNSGAEHSINLEIEPVYTVKLVSTLTSGSKPEDKVITTGKLDNSMIKAPVKISIKLPTGFPTTNLFVKHYIDSTKFEIIPVSVDGNGVATWYQSSFSTSELVNDAKTAAVTYDYENGSVQTVNYTYADSGKTLPTDSKSGYTFGGWKNTDTGDTTVYKTVDQVLGKGGTFTVTPSFTQNSGGAGGGATTYTITATAGEGGAISPTSASVESGKDQTFTITPNTGYKVKDVLVDNKSVGAVTTYTFSKVAAAHTITASFEKSAKDVSDIFNDIGKTAWYHDAVQYVYDNGLMNGTGSSFEPDATMSRAMIVATIYRLAGSPAVTGTSSFSDVKAGQWYTDAVIWAAANGIAQGYSNGAFGVNDPVTREQLVTFFYRYAQFKGYDVSIGEDTNILSYTDALTISEYAIPAMQWACGAGLVQGDGNALNPKATATRAQNAAILMRFQQNVAK